MRRNRSAAAHLGHARRLDRRHRFLADVEGWRPELVSFAEACDRSGLVPRDPEGMSRLEWFQQWIHDEPDAWLAWHERDAESYVAQLAREQWDRESEAA